MAVSAFALLGIGRVLTEKQRRNEVRMAGFATHEIFGKEVMAGISNEMLLSMIENHMGIYGIGCQGPDLFLYNIPMLIGPFEKNLGERMHVEGTGRFFAYFLQTVWEADSWEKIEVGLSYFYGMLAHYTLDSGIHPYVYARIGYDPEVPYSKKATRGLHHRLESAMDAKFLAVKREILPSEYKPCETLEADRKEREVLAEILAESLTRCYKVHVKKENVMAAIRMMKMIACGFYGCSDGRKKQLEKIEWPFCENYLFTNFLVADEYIRKRKVMNRENHVWRNPWDQTKMSDKSVWEIYDEAVEQYGEYTKAFSVVAGNIIRKWQCFFDGKQVYESRKDKNGQIKSQISAIIGKDGEWVSQKTMVKEIREAVFALGNLSYHSGLPVHLTK